jgi:hypothetical protein
MQNAKKKKKKNLVKINKKLQAVGGNLKLEFRRTAKCKKKGNLIKINKKCQPVEGNLELVAYGDPLRGSEVKPGKSTGTSYVSPRPSLLKGPSLIKGRWVILGFPSMQEGGPPMGGPSWGSLSLVFSFFGALSWGFPLFNGGEAP